LSQISSGQTVNTGLSQHHFMIMTQYPTLYTQLQYLLLQT